MHNNAWKIVNDFYYENNTEKDLTFDTIQKLKIYGVI